MLHLDVVAALIGKTLGNLKMAARICDCHDRGAGLHNCPAFLNLQLSGLFRLGDAVDAGTAATECGIGQFNPFHSIQLMKQRTGLGGNLLSMAKMAGFVIGSFDGVRDRILLQLKAYLHKPFVDVFCFRIPLESLRSVCRVFGQQRAVVLQMGSATSRIGDDGVTMLEINRIDLFPSEFPCRVQIAIVSVQGTATPLLSWRQYRTTRRGQNFGSVPVDVRITNILNAPREQPNAVMFRLGREKGGDQFIAECGGHPGCPGFESTQGRRQEPGQSQLSRDTVQAEFLNHSQETADHFQPCRHAKNDPQTQPAPESPFRSVHDPGVFDVGSGGLKQPGVVNACRAGGGAGEAAQAKIHFIAKSLLDFQFSVRHRPHQGDAASGTVAFSSGGDICRTGGQAHSAMHALLDNRIVHLLQMPGHETNR